MPDTVDQQRGAVLRDVGICLTVVSAAMVFIWPVAEIPFGDDTAYTEMALHLARTGHLTYNGWEAVVQILHTYWGAFAIRLFGFSFLTVRLSTIPYSLGAVALCYLLMRRSGLKRNAAVFVTLMFGLSPLFLPVSLSYLTDVPGLFFIFASLYSFARAEEIAGEPNSYGWLALGAIAGFIGGTGRQIAWLTPLVVLPYMAWVRRKQRLFAMCAIAAWAGELVGVVYVLAWFGRQPYTVFQASVFSEIILTLKQPFGTLVLTARLALMLVLFVLPATVPLLFRSAGDTWRGPRGRKILVAALFLIVLAAIAIHPSLASIPWISNTLNWEGIYGADPLAGRPIVLIRPIRAVVAVTVYFSVCILAGELWNIRQLARRISVLLLAPSSGEFLLAATSLFSVANFVLIIVRGSDFNIFDRYLLPIIPWAASVVLLWFAKENPGVDQLARSARPFAWVLLAVLAFYGIAITQDYWALGTARVEATRKLEAAGIPRTAIDAGFEYNGWTELLVSGHLNFYRVFNPPDAYRPGLSITPNVIPVYRLEYKPTPQTESTSFGTVPYSSMLPPFHKQVSIDRLLSAAPSGR